MVRNILLLTTLSMFLHVNGQLGSGQKTTGEDIVKIGHAKCGGFYANASATRCFKSLSEEQFYDKVDREVERAKTGDLSCTVLNVQSNALTHVAPQLLWATLRSLNVSDNGLKDLPDLSALKHLQVLQIDNNDLEGIPNLSGLPLKELWASNNSICMLDGSIGNVKTLQKLDLSNNKLSMLPSTFKNLRQLEFLNISDNKFNSIPPVICGMNGLKLVSVRNNMIGQTIPALPKGLKLDVSGTGYNPWSVDKFTKPSQIVTGYRCFLRGNKIVYD